MARRKAWLAALLSVSLLATACSGAKSDAPKTDGGAAQQQEAPQGPKVLTIGMWGSPNDLNFITNATTYSSVVYSLIYPTLYTINDKLGFEPRLAEKCDVNATSDQWTCKIRDNAKWTDGTPITADDVAYVFQVIAHPDTPTTRRSLIDTLKGTDKDGKSVTKDFNLEGVKVIDQKTVQFSTKVPVDPDAFDEKVLSNVVIMPKSQLEPAVKAGLKDLAKNAFSKSPTVFGGAFKLVSMKDGESVELAPNADYFMGKPKLDKLFIKIVDQKSFAASVQKGEIDVTAGNGIGEVPIDDWETISALPTMVQDTYTAPSYQYMEINSTLPEFSNPKVREALAHAINRQLIVTRLLKGNGEVLNTPLTSINKYYRKDLQSKLEYDPAKAKKMLQDAGFDFSKKIVLLTPTGNIVREKSADIIQANLKEIGLNVEIEKVEFNTRQARAGKGDFQLSLVGYSATFDPDFSGQVGTNQGFNYGKYANPKMDELLSQGKAVVKFEDRKKFYDQAQDLFVEDVPLLPLYAVKALCVVNKRVVGAKPGPQGLTWNAHLWDVTK